MGNSHQIAHWGQCIVLCKGVTFAKYLCSRFAYYFSVCGLIQQILYYHTKPAHVWDMLSQCKFADNSAQILQVRFTHVNGTMHVYGPMFVCLILHACGPMYESVCWSTCIGQCTCVSKIIFGTPDNSNNIISTFLKTKNVITKAIWSIQNFLFLTDKVLLILDWSTLIKTCAFRVSDVSHRPPAFLILKVIPFSRFLKNLIWISFSSFTGISKSQSEFF